MKVRPYKLLEKVLWNCRRDKKEHLKKITLLKEPVQCSG